MTRQAPLFRARFGERGFTMALLLAMIVVMVILTTAAIPKAAAVVQRDNEAELIFRGEAIANALRIYKALWDLLDRDYGMEPSRATQDLVAQIKLGDFEPTADRRARGNRRLSPYRRFAGRALHAEPRPSGRGRSRRRRRCSRRSCR